MFVYLLLMFLTLFFLSLSIAGTFLRAWKRGIAILTASDVKVTPDPRVKLIPNRYTLQINNASPADGGDYICQLATFEPREITHHVEILGKVPDLHQKTIIKMIFLIKIQN